MYPSRSIAPVIASSLRRRIIPKRAITSGRDVPRESADPWLTENRGLCTVSPSEEYPSLKVGEEGENIGRVGGLSHANFAIILRSTLVSPI